MDERMYWVAWSRIAKLGGKRLLAMHEHFGSLAAAWEAPVRALAEVPGLGPGLAAEAAAARQERDPEADWAFVSRPPVQVITWLDPDYPAPLRTIADPPPVLYAMGRLPAWERTVAIVGTRQASTYGLRVARRLARELAALGVVVVSGVAAGVDRAAHEGALAAGDGLTVGVLGCGFHSVFPAANRDLYREIADRACLMTEFPQDVKPLKAHFPLRNRIVSGLCHGVIVVEAKRKSGSLITVDHALEQGRQVFAVPGPVDQEGSEGPHDLLRNGARLVATVEDVLHELGWRLVLAEQPKADNELEQQVINLLGREGRHVDELVAGLGLSAAQAGSLLTIMELKGLVRQGPGMVYERG